MNGEFLRGAGALGLRHPVVAERRMREILRVGAIGLLPLGLPLATAGILKVLGGFRQQLQFLPFFFLGYAVMRSKPQLRRMFLILGVIALANGAVATYQTQISPTQLAGWGAGYQTKVRGVEGESGH